MAIFAVVGATAAVAVLLGHHARELPAISPTLYLHRLPPETTPSLTTLYSQDDDDNQIAIVSQNFTDGFLSPNGLCCDQYDDQGADDFIVPAGQVWTIKEVDISAVYFSGPGPADDFNVIFYADNGGVPGGAVATCSQLSYVDHSGSGSVKIGLIGCEKIKLKKGHYWISVQAEMQYTLGGEWGWGTNNDVRGYASVWRNPPNGFGTGCTNYVTTTLCAPEGEGGDFAFTLKGKLTSR